MNKPATYSLAAAALLFSYVVFASAGSGTAATSVSPLAGWARLRLTASKFLVASAESTIERYPAAPRPSLVRVASRLTYFGKTRLHQGFGERDAEDRPLPAHWMEIDPGIKAREATVDAERRLVFRRFDAPDGAPTPWRGRWKEGRREEKTLGAAGDGACGGPIDAWSFLGRLDCLAGAAETDVALLTNDGLVPVRAVRRGTRSVELWLDDLDGGEPRNPTVEAVELALLPAPGGPSPSVFGLDGEISLLVDPASGALLEIAGKRSGIPGTIRFRLVGAGFKAGRLPETPWPSQAIRADVAPPA